jgi:hypothetical protein
MPITVGRKCRSVETFSTANRHESKTEPRLGNNNREWTRMNLKKRLQPQMNANRRRRGNGPRMDGHLNSAHRRMQTGRIRRLHRTCRAVGLRRAQSSRFAEADYADCLPRLFPTKGRCWAWRSRKTYGIHGLVSLVPSRIGPIGSRSPSPSSSPTRSYAPAPGSWILAPDSYPGLLRRK